MKEEIRQNTLVRASPEEVYNAFFTAEGINSWFTHRSEIDAQPGGKIVFRWKNWGPDKYTNDAEGTVLEANRPKRFVFQWSPDTPTYVTTIEVNFEPDTKGTIVRLREYGYRNTPSGRAAMLECAAGWGEALTLLKYYVEHKIVY